MAASDWSHREPGATNVEKEWWCLDLAPAPGARPRPTLLAQIARDNPDLSEETVFRRANHLTRFGHSAEREVANQINRVLSRAKAIVVNWTFRGRPPVEARSWESGTRLMSGDYVHAERWSKAALLKELDAGKTLETIIRERKRWLPSAVTSVDNVCIAAGVG